METEFKGGYAVKLRIFAVLLLSAGLLVLPGCTKNKTTPNPSGSGQGEVAAKPDPEPAKPAATGENAAAATDPAPTDGKDPVVEFTTSMGAIKMELYPRKAPKTVANFLSYIKSGHYSGTVFHRVIDNFMVQGGGFDAQFNKKPTPQNVENEAFNGLKNNNGTVAMARTPDPHSAAAQFFINVADNEFLNHKDKSMRGWGYCVFGKVIEGMEVVNKIKAMATGSRGPFPKDVPQTDVMIKSAKVL